MDSDLKKLVPLPQYTVNHAEVQLFVLNEPQQGTSEWFKHNLFRLQARSLLQDFGKCFHYLFEFNSI